MKELSPSAGWRKKLYRIIFLSDTPAGKTFDIILIVAILSSILVVMLESMEPIRREYGSLLRGVEWFFTILFTIEYILRIICVSVPRRYIISFYGLIDFAAIAPTYLSVIIPGSHYFLVIRALRILRVFRVLKLVLYLKEAEYLMFALRASRYKITVFLSWVLLLVFIMGSLMYLIEGEQYGFSSIPKSVYWAVVTLTTVGYGDISPQTGLGQFLAAIIMLLGYSLIAVPTGIVSVEIAGAAQKRTAEKECPSCGKSGHYKDAKYCMSCGSELNKSDTV